MALPKKNPVEIGWNYACQPGAWVSLGEDGAAAPAPAPALNLRSALSSEPIKTASAIALTYHGYRRTGSILWALVYGLAGRTFPIAAVPISLAQGFGQKKSCP